MNIMVELALIFGVCLAGEGISAVLPFAFPASVIAMLLLGALLFFKILKTRHIERASHFLAGNMAFFFLPTCVGVMEHADAIMGQLAPFLLIAFSHRRDRPADRAPDGQTERGNQPCLTL